MNMPFEELTDRLCVIGLASHYYSESSEGPALSTCCAPLLPAEFKSTSSLRSDIFPTRPTLSVCPPAGTRQSQCSTHRHATTDTYIPHIQAIILEILKPRQNSVFEIIFYLPKQL